jgi:hypothetical protein
MTHFFYYLTKNNWGFPWHIILADIGVFIGLVIMNLLNPNFFIMNIGIASGAVMVIGVIYEIMQVSKSPDVINDSLQDVLADLIGVILGVGKFLLAYGLIKWLMC